MPIAYVAAILLFSDSEVDSVLVLQVVTVFLVAVAMALSLAHALEFPGKMRLPKDAYLVTQTIYYPGFTIGGFGEGLGVIATLLMLFMTPRASPAFVWFVAAFISILAMQAVFWAVTQPVNRHWVAALPLSGAASTFFSGSRSSAPSNIGDEWEHLRNTWEYSHIARALLAAISLISLTTAVAVYWRS